MWRFVSVQLVRGLHPYDRSPSTPAPGGSTSHDPAYRGTYVHVHISTQRVSTDLSSQQVNNLQRSHLSHGTHKKLRLRNHLISLDWSQSCWHVHLKNKHFLSRTATPWKWIFICCSTHAQQIVPLINSHLNGCYAWSLTKSKFHTGWDLISRLMGGLYLCLLVPSPPLMKLPLSSEPVAKSSSSTHSCVSYYLKCCSTLNQAEQPCIIDKSNFLKSYHATMQITLNKLPGSIVTFNAQ